MRRSVIARRSGAVLIGLTILAESAFAAVPFPRPETNGSNPYDYESYAFIDNGECRSGTTPTGPRELPQSFDCKKHHKVTNYAPKPGDPDYDPQVEENPAEYGGVKGSRMNKAWEVTTGRPDVVIAVMDSGIKWDGRNSVTGALDLNPVRRLRKKFFLNAGELPRPGPPGIECALHPDTRFGGYDRNCDGVFNVVDYEQPGCLINCAEDLNGNTLIDPEDLILQYSDSVDGDANGYPDDVSGWDFFENDNDANDDTDYGHGTGESEDSGAEADSEAGGYGNCPNCMLMEMRVGDSFIADVNHFAEAVVYAVDNGASVVQEALGTLNNSSFGQAAVDYAYENGVVIVASAADESAGHHNYPSNYNHTMIVNSVTKFFEAQTPRSYLYFNGCTNFGGHMHVAVPSTSCSSDATGQSSGYAGLVYSAAKNSVDRGWMTNYPRDDGTIAPYPLSAEEVMQIFRRGAEDIDFSPPNSINGWFTATAVPSRRFQSVNGWDMFFGYGRTNINDTLRKSGLRERDAPDPPNLIPPEADITEPAWFAPLPDTGSIPLVGRAAANRSSGFTYVVQWAPGAQPRPAGDDQGGQWRTLASGESTTAISGELALLPMEEIAAAVRSYGPTVFDPATDPTSQFQPEKDAFRVRVRVVDADGNVGNFQKQLFVLPEDTEQGLLPGFPRYIGSDGAGSPALVNLDEDQADELVLSTSDGIIHAYNDDGTEISGWPVVTDPIDLPTTGTNAYTEGAVPSTVYGAVLLGSPAVADIVPGDAGEVEIAAADLEGKLYVWNRDGTRAPGFPVMVDARFSEEPGCEEPGTPPGADGALICDDYLGDLDVRDKYNARDHGFNHNPAAADLDPLHPGLELVVGANDDHVYAWHADGSPVEGWPVLLRDPAKVASVHPVTHKYRYRGDAQPFTGSKIVAAPSVGDIDADEAGDLEVVAVVNEEYREPPNASKLREQLHPLIAALRAPGNGRIYALDGRGNAAPASQDETETAHPDDQAYADGWPVPIAILVAELLPYVGEGPDGAPTLADVDDNGDLEIGIATHAGPGYILEHNGESRFGRDPEGKYITLSTEEFKGTSTDAPSYVAVGGGVFGRLVEDRFGWVAPSAGLRRLLDVLLPAQQLGAEDQVSSWDTETGSYFKGFPAIVNDLQFFNTPSIMDVSGDDVPEVLEGTSVYDVHAYNALNVPVEGWPKFTGGWAIAAPGTGDLNADGNLDVVEVTREGWLFAWSTDGDACQRPEWPKYQHDLANTGNHAAEAPRPAGCSSAPPPPTDPPESQGPSESPSQTATPPPGTGETATPGGGGGASTTPAESPSSTPPASAQPSDSGSPGGQSPGSPPEQAPTVGSSPGERPSTPPGTEQPAGSPTTGSGTSEASSPGEPGGRAPRFVTLEIAPRRARHGRHVKVAGTVSAPDAPPSCRSSVTVALKRHVLGGPATYEEAEHLVTAADGTFGTMLRADRGSAWIATVAASSECEEATSSPRHLIVAKKVLLRGPQRARGRGVVRLRVRVAPCRGHHSSSVVLLMKSGAIFGAVETERLDRRCRASFRQRVRRTTTFKARAGRSDQDHVRGTSRAHVIRVRSRSRR